jgi:hypothetical protein
LYILEQYELLVQQIQIQQQADITPICNINSGFVTAAIHEELEKQVNTIYMNTFAQGISDFNTTQLNTLRLIANYCPQEGGAAVHQAQGLLSLVEDVDFLNFDCVNEQTKTIEKEEEEESFEIDWTVQLFPNPTHNELTIKSSLLLEGNTTIEIFNALGQLVMPITKHKKLQMTIIDVSTLLDGVYTMRLKNGEESITKSFIVIK